MADDAIQQFSIELIGKVKADTKSAEKEGEKLADSVESGFHKATKNIKNDGSFSSILSGVKVGGSLVKGTFGAMASGIKAVGDKARQTLKPVTTLFNQIKRIAFYRMIRSALKAITEGFEEGRQNAYQWAVVNGNQFARSMDMIATAMLYVKNSIGAMTMPLTNYLAPIIDKLADGFVVLVNAINQFIATITGASTWVKAIKYPTQYAEAVSGAAKEIKNQLLGFDELNVLNAPSGSGSGAALDYGNMFQEMELSVSNLDFAKAIKDAIKQSNWKEVGKLLAQRLNSVISGIQAVDLSKAFGEKLNNAISMVHSFLTEFSFQEIGVKIGEFISNLNLDWAKISESWLRWRLKFFDILMGLVKGINWANVGHSIGEYFKGLFNGFTTWLGQIDWTEMGRQATQRLFDIIGSIDWNGLLISFYNGLAGILRAAWNWLGGAFQTLIKLFTGDVSIRDLIDRANAQYSSAISGGAVAGGIGVAIGARGYAQGGFPDEGSLFYAGEGGRPELVAQIGGRTGVMNTDQMAQSLASANEGVVMAITTMGNAVVSAINHKDTSININDVRRAMNSMKLRYGV